MCNATLCFFVQHLLKTLAVSIIDNHTRQLARNWQRVFGSINSKPKSNSALCPVPRSGQGYFLGIPFLQTIDPTDPHTLRYKSSSSKVGRLRCIVILVALDSLSLICSNMPFNWSSVTCIISNQQQHQQPGHV